MLTGLMWTSRNKNEKSKERSVGTVTKRLIYRPVSITNDRIDNARPAFARFGSERYKGPQWITLIPAQICALRKFRKIGSKQCPLTATESTKPDRRQRPTKPPFAGCSNVAFRSSASSVSICRRSQNGHNRYSAAMRDGCGAGANPFLPNQPRTPPAISSQPASANRKCDLPGYEVNSAGAFAFW